MKYNLYWHKNYLILYLIIRLQEFLVQFNNYHNHCCRALKILCVFLPKGWTTTLLLCVALNVAGCC